MSWHHGDWLALAQVLASIFAIIGAYGVVFYQDHLAEGRNIKRRGSVRTAIVEITRKAGQLARELHDPTNAYKGIGTWEQYRAFRARQLMEYHDLVAALPGQDIAEISLLEVAMNLRINFRDLAAIIAESNFHDANGWPTTKWMIGICKGNLDTIAVKLSADEKTSKASSPAPVNPGSHA